MVPVVRPPESEEALVAAARLAAERRATIAIVHVLEVPLHLEAEEQLPELERGAHELLDSAQALVESYGVRATTRLMRGAPGSAGQLIVEDAKRRAAELFIVGEPRAGRRRGFRAHGRLHPARGSLPGARRGGTEGGMRRRATLALSVVLVGIGVVLLVETALYGGGIGYLFGALFLLAGALRGYLSIVMRTDNDGVEPGLTPP